MAGRTVSASYAVRELPGGVRAAEWDGLMEGAPGGGHIFQSHEWGEIKRRLLKWKPVRLVLEKDGGEACGAGQFLVRRTTPLVPGALMFCPKGPWLPWDDEEAVRAFFGGLRAVAERKGAHTVKIEPEVTEDRARVKEVLSEIGFHKFRWDLHGKTTMVVDLEPSEEELLARMKGKTRYNIRLAARKGVAVVEDNSPQGLDAFWSMFEETSERNGFWHRPRGYFFAVWRALYEAGRMHLFFAEHEGERLAGMLVHTFGRKYYYIAGASIDEKRNLMPTYLLQWEVMKWAKERGMTYYDMMGIPSPDELNEDHPWYGVYKFKSGFGGEIPTYLGCLDLPVKPTRAKMWNRMEPIYYRLYQRLKGDIYY